MAESLFIFTVYLHIKDCSFNEYSTRLHTFVYNRELFSIRLSIVTSKIRRLHHFDCNFFLFYASYYQRYFFGTHRYSLSYFNEHVYRSQTRERRNRRRIQCLSTSYYMESFFIVYVSNLEGGVFKIVAKITYFVIF